MEKELKEYYVDFESIIVMARDIEHARELGFEHINKCDVEVTNIELN